MEQVALFRCTHCGVRMFEKDRQGHLERHGIKADATELASHFTAGPKEQSSRPGDEVKPMYYSAGSKRKAKVAPVVEIDVDDLN